VNRGSTTLPAALAAVAVSVALGGALAELTRVEVVLARQRDRAAAALAASDACLADAVVGLPPDWDFAALLAGPDGTLGTADDGVVTALPGCIARARTAPRPGGAPRALLRIDAQGGGGRRLLDAVLGRDPEPGIPALVWLGAPPPAGAVNGNLAVDGADPSDPTAADWAGLAAPDDPAALDAWTAAEGTHVTASARTRPPMVAPAPPITALGARVAASHPSGAGALTPTPGPPPQLVFVHGDLLVTGTLHGAGLVFVDGTLDIRGSFDFTGLVVVSGGVRVAAGASFMVAGALWAGLPAGSVLQVDGTASLAHAESAIHTADALLPLPRRAVLLGMRDL